MLIARQSSIVCTPVSCPQSLVVPRILREQMLFVSDSSIGSACGTGLASCLICIWIPVTFHNFSEVFFSCYRGHILNDRYLVPIIVSGV